MIVMIDHGWRHLSDWPGLLLRNEVLLQHRRLQVLLGIALELAHVDIFWCTSCVVFMVCCVFFIVCDQLETEQNITGIVRDRTKLQKKNSLPGKVRRTASSDSVKAKARTAEMRRLGRKMLTATTYVRTCVWFWNRPQQYVIILHLWVVLNHSGDVVTLTLFMSGLLIMLRLRLEMVCHCFQ